MFSVEERLFWYLTSTTLYILHFWLQVIPLFSFHRRPLSKVKCWRESVTSRVRAFTSWGGTACAEARSSRIPCSPHLPSPCSTRGSLLQDWPGRGRGWVDVGWAVPQVLIWMCHGQKSPCTGWVDCSFTHLCSFKQFKQLLGLIL